MSILGHAGILLKKPVAGVSLVGFAWCTAAGTLTYPAGIQNGDLMVICQHGGGVPSGWTLRSTTPGGTENGYAAQNSMKIYAGGTSVVAAGATNYDAFLIVVRGATTLDTTYSYNDATGGTARSYTASGTPKNVIAIGWDRGATGYPTASATGREGQMTGTSTYFRDVAAFYPALAVGASCTITDYSDTYSTNCLFVTVA